MHATAALLVSTVLLAGPPEDSDAEVTPQGFLKLPHCVVALVNQAEVPARDAGVVVDLQLREGAAVRKGQIVGKLDDADVKAKFEIAEYEYKAAKEQASNDIRVRAAKAEAEVQENEYLRGGDLQSLSNAEAAQRRLRRLLLSPRRAKLQTEVAEFDLQIAGLTSQVKAAQLAAAKNELQRRLIAAPLDGEIAKVFLNEGEWVNPGDPIAHVVRMDRLRVEGLVPAAEFSRDEILGRQVTIQVAVRRGRTQQLGGKITFASPLVQTNGHYLVYSEFDNIRSGKDWVVRPGLKAELVIHVSRSDDRR